MPIERVGSDGTTQTIAGVERVASDGSTQPAVAVERVMADGTIQEVWPPDTTENSLEDQLEAEFHIATNDHRASQGLPDYEYRDDVAAVARSHSQNMYEQQNLSHTLDGKSASDRLDDAGITWNSVAENIAWQGTDPIDGSQSQLESIAQSFIDSWLSSTGHRENIESSRDGEGIGVYIDDVDDIVWATAVFISP